MIFGTLPDLAIAGTAFGIGRAYHKPWLAIAGGVFGVITLVHFGLIVITVREVAKAREAGA